MDEIRCAFGLLNLRQIDKAIEFRQHVATRYREALKGVVGIEFWEDIPGVKHNYSYFPIFVDKEKYGISRDELYYKMREHNIWGRRYFYPLISDFEPYNNLPSANPENLPVATKMAEEVICLPIHHEISEEEVQRVISLIKP